MKYEYDVDDEIFKRVDRKGVPLEFNIIEGKRIESMRNLGCSVQKIYDKINFVNDVSITNLRTFIKNLENGNLSVDGDYPAPKVQFRDMNIEARVTKLENDLDNFKTILYKSCECKDDDENTSFIGKVKSWMS